MMNEGPCCTLASHVGSVAAAPGPLTQRLPRGKLHLAHGIGGNEELQPPHSALSNWVPGASHLTIPCLGSLHDVGAHSTCLRRPLRGSSRLGGVECSAQCLQHSESSGRYKLNNVVFAVFPPTTIIRVTIFHERTFSVRTDLAFIYS